MFSKKDIVLISTSDWDYPFWTNKQYTAKYLSKRGHRILYIESLGLRAPKFNNSDIFRIFRRLSKFFKGIKVVDKNIWVYSPLVLPFHSYKFVRILNHFLLEKMIKFYIWKLKFKNVFVWTYNPLESKLILKLSPQKIIYHCVDDLSSAPALPHHQIKLEENKLAKISDLIFVTSLELKEINKKRAPNKTFYFPNVVDYNHFAKARGSLKIPKCLDDIPRPRIGFIGAISSYKLDFKLISKLAKKNPNWNWILIGKVGEGQPDTNIDQLKSNNIHLLGPKSYSRLPAFLKGLDVVTIPSPYNSYTKSMFPMKFFEYMAAGRPIVTTAIASIKEFKDACYYSYTEEEFEKNINQALEKGLINEKLCDQLAKENTWEKRLGKMLYLINQQTRT